MYKLKLLSIFFLLIVFTNIISSQNEILLPSIKSEDYYLDIDKRKVLFKDLDLDSVIVKVNTNMKWRASTSCEWVKIENLTDSTFTIKSVQNLKGYRNGKITVEGYIKGRKSISADIEVSQSIAVPTDFKTNIDFNDENNVVLKWNNFKWKTVGDDKIYFEIYRDSVLIATTQDTTFVDKNVELGGDLCYNVSAVQITSEGIITKSNFTPEGVVFLKSPLIVTASNIYRYIGRSNPNVSNQYVINGFVDKDDITYLSKRPVCTIDPFKYDTSIPVGTYRNAIEVKGAEDATGKYRFIYISGSLIVSSLSSNAGLSYVTINGTTTSTVPDYYAIDCSSTKDEIDIVVKPSHNYATVKLISSNTNAHISGKTITVKTDKPSKQEVVFEIVAQDGITSNKHRITIEKYFPFYDIVVKYLDIALTAINKPESNGGYNFVTYKWYRDGELIGTSQSYSSEEDTNGTYYLELTTDKGEVLRTCAENISLKSNRIMLAPNDFIAKLDANDENNVVLSWVENNCMIEPDDYIYYEVYRNNELISTTEKTSFIEEKTMLAGNFDYKVCAVRKTADNTIIKSSFTPIQSVFFKYPLIVTANNISRYVGFSNPKISDQYTIRGFVDNDDINYLSTRPIASIDPLKYHMSIPEGSYRNAVEVNGGKDAKGKYRFMYVYANLTVIPLSDNADLSDVTVNGTTTSYLPDYYAIDCSNMKNEIDIIIRPSHTYATVKLISGNHTAHISGNKITVNTSKPSKQEVIFEILAQNGVTSTKHRITIEKYFSFQDIVINRWDIALTAINNPINNGGYNFLKYKWFKDGQLIGTSQSYSSEEKINGTFYLEVTTDKGDLLRTCDEHITLIGNRVKVYPNPVALGETICVETDCDQELLKNAVIEIYDLSGLKIQEIKVKGQKTEVKLNGAAGTYILKFKGQNGLSKDFKIIRK